MKNIIFSILILMLFSSFFKEPNRFDSGFITLNYNGDILKPYPRIMFYLSGSNEAKEDSISTHKLEISLDNFERITAEIESSRGKYRDSSFLSSNEYELVFSKNGETTIILTPYLPRVRQIFNIISIELKDTNEDVRMIKYQLNSVLIRLLYDNKLDQIRN